VTDRADDRFGSLLPDLKVRPPGDVSRELAERLHAVESRNVTYVGEHWPIFWEEARGSNVRDADGNVYLDLTGAFGVALLGHAHPAVVDAIQAQVLLLVHGMGDIHPPTIKLELLERLADLAPWGETRTVLASSGGEAVEAALKTAQVATGKPGILAFPGGYHGLTLGALAAVERAHFRARFEPRIYGGVAFAPFPDVLRHGEKAGPECLARVESALKEGAPNGDPIGAVIVEPVQGRGGVRVPPGGFMSALSSLATDAGALVIADEIFTGLGRCGSFLASTGLGLDPDLICLGKALGGGLPVSACLGRADVMDQWPESSGEAIHTSTFLGHPVACAAALAVLDTFEAEGVVERVSALGEHIVALLGARLGEAVGLADVRGAGLMIGLEFADPGTLTPTAGFGGRLAEKLLEEGVLVLPAGAQGEVLELTPAFNLNDEQLIYAVDTIGRVVEDVG
jgi:4-aminobutyrate aminotransferase-like enzyme